MPAPVSEALVDDNPFLVRPGEPAGLADRVTRLSSGEMSVTREQAVKELHGHWKRLDELQEKLYAESRRALLVVFQAIDAGGKDGTIRRVLGRLNPQGVRVASFKVPSSLERSHDFLWRHHLACPPRGHIGIHNRSHYETILVERVKDLVPRDVWLRRYEQINRFEAMLAVEGTTVLKFFLHLGKDEQARRFRRRLTRPDKWWKFSKDDLAERDRWDDYQLAFEDALTRCSTSHAPWYAIPADRKWYRDVTVARIVVKTLENLDPRYPAPDPDTEANVKGLLKRLGKSAG